MLKIRLDRKGRKNDPFYRIVVVDSRSKRGATPAAVIGYWHPREENKKLDQKGLQEWVKKGAQISSGVKKILS